MKTKIRWSMEERIKLQERVNELYAESDHWELFAALREAQKILPQNRRRKLISINQNAPWLKKPERHLSVIRPIEKLPELEYIEPPPPPIDKLQQIKDLLGDLLYEVIYDVISQVKSDLKVTSVIGTKKSEEKSVKPKILIYGMMPSQVKHIENDFKNEFDLRFGKNWIHSRIRQVSSNSDKTIVMTKFIGHDEYTHLKAGGNIIHCNGGLTELSDLLTKLYCA